MATVTDPTGGYVDTAGISPERYAGKVVIITGGSKGIGRGCVEIFVRGGAHVVFCSRGAEEGKKVEKEVNALGIGSALFVQCDVSKKSDLEYLVATTVATHDTIDCVLNNAGTHPYHQPIDSFTEDNMLQLFQINFMSVFTLSRLTLPYLRKSGGNIIIVSSYVGTYGQPGATTYISTKGALTAFSKGLAIDEAPNGVRVNSVSPGNIWTPLWDDNATGSDNRAASIQGGIDAQIMGRMGTVQEAGRLCLYIAAEATYTTGQDFIISGGAELGYGMKNRVKKVSN